MKKNPFYYAKILLFGEYGIINDAKGLSIPFNYYNGAFKPGDLKEDKAARSNAHLRKYREHLQSLERQGTLPTPLDLDAFKQDLERGFYFDSSIPEGYGVGSSGALVAAIYDRYGRDVLHPESELDKDKILQLKEIFGQMEAYFHGRSSGIDPLICYLGLPVLINSKNDLGTVVMPANDEKGQAAIFLLNSGQPGETQPMVNIFMEKMKNEGFRTVMKEQFNRYNDACIQAFLNGDSKPLFSNLKKLSKLILDYFTPMIPHSLHDLWREGLETNDYYLKLCGSGGGGYVLGFTRNYEQVKEQLSAYRPELIHRF